MLVFRINIGNSGLMRILVYLCLVISVAGVLYYIDSSAITATDAENQPVKALPAVGSKTSNGANVVFGISVHKVDELRQVLQRAEELVSQPKSASQPANIQLLLHGPEIQFFSIDKYPQYKDIVDLAARLDAYNVVELKMCETAMKDLGVKKDDIPGFIEFVPNGDIELEKLSRRGFSVM